MRALDDLKEMAEDKKARDRVEHLEGLGQELYALKKAVGAALEPEAQKAVWEEFELYA